MKLLLQKNEEVNFKKQFANYSLTNKYARDYYSWNF